MMKELWSDEYQRKGIPSSYRTEPTQAVIDFASLLSKLNYESHSAIDLGCGTGRNAFFLAKKGLEVVALDWVATNVAEINAKALEHRLRLKAFCQSVVDPWPVETESLDIAIDIFCYKHLVDKQQQAIYRQHLLSALRKGGYYLLSLAAEDDGFYGPLLRNSSAPEDKFVIDPYSKIGSFLYSQEELLAEFSEGFHLVASKNDRKMSPMHGKEYTRSLWNMVFQKI
jgi:SAM-dependent methyltransferase